jgi:hypothetical protein
VKLAAQFCTAHYKEKFFIPLPPSISLWPVGLRNQLYKNLGIERIIKKAKSKNEPIGKAAAAVSHRST